MSRFSLPPDVADRVLDALQNDPAYRERFRKNPRLALEEKGHAEAADPGIAHDDGIWACFQVSRLPGEAEIAATREALKAQLTSQAAYRIFNKE